MLPANRHATYTLDTIADSVQTNQTDQTLINKNFILSGAAGPIVREYNPAATAGVIPIAVGSSNTAATNPQPEILGKTGSSVSGVSFNILTYAAPDTSNETVIQQHVDTRVIACSCKYGAQITDTTDPFAQPYQATYWDGTKYVSPKVTTAKTSTTGVDSNATQDPYCDACCRDRNDTTTGADNTIKFDPFTSDYAHYKYVAGTLTKVLTTDTASAFLNDCRMIRVDGQYRTAVDMQNYFFGLLATTSTGTSPVPDPTAVSSYQSFITTFLNNSITSLAAGTGPESKSTATAAYTAAGLDSPTSIPLNNAQDKRYLHARGLYIDYLEPDALKAINSAITTCGSTSACILPLLPFTTINETELANWTSSVNNVITVTNTASLTADDPLAPLRGVTTEINGATNGATANAIPTIGLSNSGVIGNIAAWAVDTDDLATTLTDSQPFSIGGQVSGGSKLYFNVAMSFPTSPSTYNWITNVNSNVPTAVWNGTAAQLGTAVTNQNTTAWTYQSSSPFSWTWYGSCVAGAKKGDPEVCTPSNVSPTIAAPVGLNVIVQNQNLHTENLGSDSATASDGTKCPSTAALQCFNYPVDLTNIKITAGATGTTTTVSGATAAAYPSGTTDLTGQVAATMVTIPATPGISSTDSTKPDIITIGFGAPTVTVQPGTCTITRVKGKNTYVYHAATSCPQ